jgi:hypothetical protein
MGLAKSLGNYGDYIVIVGPDPTDEDRSVYLVYNTKTGVTEATSYVLPEALNTAYVFDSLLKDRFWEKGPTTPQSVLPFDMSGTPN